eukprot:TRINITY_DN67421_c0_g1_i2.p1 TRINITY_DN67421_c0_g1~~TRINITY_DN67421_c0_g1_i2.p1  ORF type:complete len:672 (-),score=97.25 TRINITY_DN67421_c0_g1_i2:9-2024(-)
MWLLTTVPLEALPALVTQNCVVVETISFDREHASLESRHLVVAVEEGNLFAVRQNLYRIVELPEHDQVELFRKAPNEEICLTLLEGDTAFVRTARSRHGASLLDIGVERTFYDFVHKVMLCGGRSEILEFDRMLSPESERMLDLILRFREGEPFDVLAAVHRTAQENNLRVMRKLFDSRVDVEFNHTCYPVALAIESGHRDMVQLITDRMETVGLPPYNEPKIALHILLQLFKPLEARLSANDRTQFSPFKLEMAERLVDTVAGHHAIPYQFVEDIIVHNPKHALPAKLLQIVDYSQQPGPYFYFFLDYDPGNPGATQCARLYLQEMTVTEPNIEVAKQRMLRAVIKRGEEAAHLVLPILNDGVTANYRLAIREGSTERARTAVMQCLETPGNPEALKLLLRRPATDVAVKNERGLNALQQLVVDIISDPIPFIRNEEGYGLMCRDLIRAGIDTDVSPPAFFTSLFSYCAKLELSHLCLPLLATTANASPFLHTSDNLIANIANHWFQRTGCAGTNQFTTDSKPAASSYTLAVSNILRSSSLMLAEPDEEEALDNRYFEPKPQDKWAMWRSLLPLPPPVVLRVMNFCHLPALAALSRTCVRFYLLSLSHPLWDAHLAERGPAPFDPVYPGLISSKFLCRSAVTREVPRLYVKSAEQRMTCLFTGEVLERAA